MNRKNEDKLIELAFGDLSPEEAGRLEAQATKDPAAASALSNYRSLREDLRLLGEVPEHQLSNERLRDAILARGLTQNPEPKPASSSRGWLWMPVTACALAFALVLWRNVPGPAGEPNIVMLPDAERSLKADDPGLKIPEGIEIDVPEPTFSSPEPETKVTAAQAAPTTKLAPVDETEPKPTVTRQVNNRSRHQPKARPKAAEKKPAEYIAMNDSAVAASAMAPGETVQYVGSIDQQPIVLIAQEKDIDTGAHVATEVESASNVLVGG